ALAQHLALINVGLLKVAASVVELGAVRPCSDPAFKIPADERAIGVDADLQPKTAAIAALVFDEGVGDARGYGDGVVAEDVATVVGAIGQTALERASGLHLDLGAPFKAQELRDTEVG